MKFHVRQSAIKWLELLYQMSQKNLKTLEKILISKKILFKKIAIMHGKGELSKSKGSICNILRGTANICNILPRPAVSNVLVVFELKRDLKYRRHVYFEPVCPHITHQAHADLKSHNEFYEDISVAKGLSREDMFRLFEIVEIQGENKNVTEKIISNRKEMSENRNDTETEYASIKDLLNMHRTPSNETTSCLILR